MKAWTGIRAEGGQGDVAAMRPSAEEGPRPRAADNEDYGAGWLQGEGSQGAPLLSTPSAVLHL